MLAVNTIIEEIRLMPDLSSFYKEGLKMRAGTDKHEQVYVAEDDVCSLVTPALARKIRKENNGYRWFVKDNGEETALMYADELPIYESKSKKSVMITDWIDYEIVPTLIKRKRRSVLFMEAYNDNPDFFSSLCYLWLEASSKDIDLEGAYEAFLRILKINPEIAAMFSMRAAMQNEISSLKLKAKIDNSALKRKLVAAKTVLPQATK